MTQPSSSSVWGVAERIVVTPVGKVRSEVVRLLGQRGFTLTTDQLTLIEGNRGSVFAGASRSESKVPVQVRVRLTAGDPGCALWIEIRDSWKLPMSRPVSVYQDIIADVLQGLDEILRRLDPLAPEFPEPTRSWHAFVEADGGADRASAKLGQVANRYLDHDAGDAPKGWRDKGMVSIVTPGGVADLPVDTLYGMVTAGTLVASKPGPMPPRLVAQVELVVGMLERLLETAGSWSGNSWIELDDKSVPVVEFLVQQAKIREAVPLRTLQVCVTCRLARVVNPDYARLRSRTTKLRTLQSSLGAIISTQGISPFVLIGKLSQMNQLDPEFVCPRCQGLHAENSIMTFCPQCGDQRDESALRECGKCKYDFRGLAKTKDLWHEPLPLPPVEQYPGMLGVPADGHLVYPAGYQGDGTSTATPFPNPEEYVSAGYPSGYPGTPPSSGYPAPRPEPYPRAYPEPHSSPGGYPGPYPATTAYPGPYPATTAYPGAYTGTAAYPGPYPADQLYAGSAFGPETGEQAVAPGQPGSHPPHPHPAAGVPAAYAPGYLPVGPDPIAYAPAGAPTDQLYSSASYAQPSFPEQHPFGGGFPQSEGLPYVPPAGQYAPGQYDGDQRGADHHAAGHHAADHYAADHYAADQNSPGEHLLPAWYPDPAGRHEFRWWDGTRWAEFVLDNDQSSSDPL